MPMTKEERREYNKKWYEKNKERLLKKQREYNEIHKEEKAEYDKEYRKEYREKNKEKIREQKKEYYQTPAGKKTHTIADWKYKGLICDDYDSLYAHYIVAENCEECNVKFGVIGDGSGTYRCMDHSHETGVFRNFLCCKCNLARG